MTLPLSLLRRTGQIAAAALAATLMLAPSSAIAQTCGSLTNSGFESDLTGWMNAANTSVVTDAHSGAKAARTGPPDGMSRVDSGSVFSAMRRMRPSPRIKIMSRGI